MRIATLLLLLLPSLVLAQQADDDKAPTEKLERAVAAHKAQEEAILEGLALARAANEAVQAAKTEQEKQAAEKLRAESSAKAKDLLFGSRDKFRAAFAESDWEEYALPAQQAVLADGLTQLGQWAMQADPALAVKAYQTFLRRLPGHTQAAQVRNEYLPMALLGAIEPTEALKEIEALAKLAGEHAKYIFDSHRADAYALAGDYENARKHYQLCADNLPKGRTPFCTSGAAMKARLVGNAAPEIDSKQWFGADARKLSALQGKVVIVDFWATWCGPCRLCMPGLDELQHKYREKGLVVLGVTHEFGNGFLPRDAAQMKETFAEGESVREIKPEDFPAHLRKFRELSGIQYPFVIASKAEKESWGVPAWPTMYVVDKEGKVAFASVGGGRERLIERAVARLAK